MSVNTYSERASQAEMRFAGHYLNLAGICLLVAGMLSYLKVSGFSQKATDSGWLQCSLGLFLGVFLSWAGDRAHRRGLSAYAQPMLASGSSLLLLTLGAGYSYFHLVPAPVMLVGTFGLVIWASVAALYYRSPWLGAYLLLALYAGPLAMKFSLGQGSMGMLVAYLLAIHLATTVVAYRQRWDAFLLGSFLGTYGLFFYHFGTAYPGPTLAFLVTIYSLFVLSANGFSLLRGGASDVDLWLSSANPLIFAFVSYPVLLWQPNSMALLVYGGIAATHLAFALASWRRGYDQMAQSNLALGILFGEASVSFLTYCSDNTSFFAVVTMAWLAQGFALLQVSRHLGSNLGLAQLARRGSYLALALAGAQLLYVVPTMDQPFWVKFPAALCLLLYFWVHERAESTLEERLFANLVVLLALFSGGQCLLDEALVPWGLMAASALAPVMMAAYQRFPVTLAYYRGGSLLLALSVTLLGLSLADLWLIPSGLFLALLTLLTWRRQEAAVGITLAATLWVRAALLVWGTHSWGALLLVALVARGLHQLGRSLPGLSQAALALQMAVTVPALLLPGQGFALLALIGLILHPRIRILLAMKLAFTLDSGSGSSLLWALLGLALLQRHLQYAAPLLACAFFKSVALDADFIVGSGGLELAGMRAIAPWHLAQVVGIVACFAAAARRMKETPEWRNVFTLFALLVTVFEISRILYDIYGQLDTFQVILSGFWAAASLFFVGYGTYFQNKLCRLFGLVLLVSCVGKMYAIDIWVLNAYDQSTTTLVMGFLLMLVSFLYQFNRQRLEYPGGAGAEGRRSLAYDL
ncbi:DUF2339 domain-containing protein [bacterium]|nr:DUF2339 domain-containing protein [bacterium]